MTRLNGHSHSPPGDLLERAKQRLRLIEEMLSPEDFEAWLRTRPVALHMFLEMVAEDAAPPVKEEPKPAPGTLLDVMTPTPRIVFGGGS